MEKHKIVKTTSLVVLVLAVAGLPIFGIGILFGLAGSDASNFALIGVGYIGVLIFSLLSFLKPKYFWLVVIALIVGIVGLVKDQNFWNEHNDRLCTELRAEPSCVEDACGFSCEDFDGGGFVTSYGVCSDKPVEMCKIEMSHKNQQTELKDKALDEFENIVLQIVDSKNPQTLDFESERVAIYNCLREIRTDGRDGENDAIARLSSLKLSSDQLNKYYDYLAMHGQNVNRQTPRPIAGLPAGDTSLSCDDLE